MSHLGALICLLLSLSAAAQDTITIRFTNPHQWVGPYGSAQASELFRFHTDSVFYYDGGHQVTLPSELDLDKGAFGFEFFTGLDNPAIENVALVAVDDFRSPNRKLYVDYNGNLDLTDDGDPEILVPGDTAVIYFRNASNTEGLFGIAYTAARPLTPEIRERANAFWARHPWAIQNEITHSDYWLSSTRLNKLVQETIVGNDSILVGLMDWDCNGLYNTLGEDRVLVGDYRTGEMSDRLSEGAFTIIPNTIVEINDTFYEVVEVEETGSYVRLVSTDRKPPRLKPGDALPDFSMESLDGDSTSLYAQLTGDEYYLLDVWGTWCKGCAVQLPRLKEANEKYQQLKVIGLNFGDTPENAQQYIEENEITWFNGQCDESIMDVLLLDKFPYYVLLTADKRIVKLNLDLHEIGELLGE